MHIFHYSYLTSNIEKIFQLALEGHTTGIKVNDIPINNLRYADDAMILAKNNQELQTILNATNEIGRNIVLITLI